MSKKIYRVWHDRAWPGRDLITEMTGEIPLFPDDYVQVANVRADGPEEAVKLTVDQGGTPDDPRPWSAWERNEGVEALVRRPRDTGAGDVVVDPQGRAYRVKESGIELFAVPPDRSAGNRQDGGWPEEALGGDGEAGPITAIRRLEASLREKESERDGARARAINSFREAVDEMKRDAAPAYPSLGAHRPRAEVAESDKLEQIVLESWKVSPSTTDNGQAEGRVEWIGVPGVVALETVEREVNPAGLHPAQQTMLRDLRAWVDGGAYADAVPAGKDTVGMALARIVGIGSFESEVEALKHQDGPWAQLPEAVKVRALVDLALEAGPPGAYALEVIAREVDPGRLPEWRREPLKELLGRLDRGQLDGDNPNPMNKDDRAGLALRLYELDARIEDHKHAGDDDFDPGRYRRWEHCLEEVKCRAILEDITALGLTTERAAYEVLAREVALQEMPEEEQHVVEAARAEAWPSLDSADPTLGNGRGTAETPDDAKVRGRAEGATLDGQRRMPSEAQMERIVNAIQSLREDYSFKRVDDEHVALAPHGRGTEDGYFFWDELVPAHRRDALARGLDWDGFSASDQGDVIIRVLDGEPSHLWMRGVKEYNPWEDFAWPLTEKQHAAYLADIAASYGMTTEEMDDYYERMATEDGAEIEDETGMPLPAPVDDAADGGDRIRHSPDEFDRVAADLPQAWAEGGHESADGRWEDQPAESRVYFLAASAVRYGVPFERFAGVARETIGTESGIELIALDDATLRRGFDGAREVAEWLEAGFRGDFDTPGEAGGLSRPGPGEEIPRERVERQIGHIKLRPDPYDFSTEELSPWDTEVSEEWTRLPEAEKLARLVSQVDWRDIGPEERREVLLREVDLRGAAEEMPAQFLDLDGPGAGAQVDREALLRETHQLARDLGYFGFRDEYFNDPDSVSEWPDAAVRERELKSFWDSYAEDSFAGFRESHAHESTKTIMAYRDHLRDLSQADENSQRAFYREVSALGRTDRIEGEQRDHIRCMSEAPDMEDEIPTGEESRTLQAAVTHDYGLGRMEDRGVRYEDEVERLLDHAEARKPLNIVERARLAGEEDAGRGAERDRYPERER